MQTLILNKQLWQIVLACTLLACVLGISVDLVTANVAVDYFAVHHPQIINTRNPWVLAIFWGIAASWWAGAISGIVVGTVNKRRANPLETNLILKWASMGCLLIWMVMISIVLGIYVFAGTIPDEVRPTTFEYDRRLVAVAMAHQYEYAIGAFITLVIALITWRRPNVKEQGKDSAFRKAERGRFEAV